jgi:hypothetical protein
MVAALRGTQAVNIGLKMPYNRPITFIDSDGNTTRFTASEEQTRFLFKMIGCGEEQHYKHCTPHALQCETDLWCPFCKYNCDGWVAAGKGSIVVNELLFMQLLLLLGVSSQWCHQVRHWWWGACIDFFDWQLGVYVQVDGHSHWYGVHSVSHAEVMARDLRCNMRALWAGVGLARVHESDLQQPDVVMAAIAIAATECAVVFTAGYKQIGWGHVILLQQVLYPYCSARTDAYGNTVIAKTNMPTW